MIDRATQRIARGLVGLGALVLASPAIVMVLGSLRGRGLPPPRGLELVPTDATLSAYTATLDLLPWGTYLRNSVTVVALAVPLTLVVGSLAGWGIRMLPPRQRRVAIAITLVALLVPVTAVWATRFELYRLVGAVDTLVPLVALGLIATSPFFVLVYAWAFHRLDPEVLEAAAMDGAGAVRTWWSVALPQVRAITLGVTVLAFTFHWGNFLDPLLYLQTQDHYTAPLGVRLLQQFNPTDWPLIMAAATMLALPPVLVLVIGQRWVLHDPLGRRS